MLDISIKDLERVIYFNSFIIIEVLEEQKEKALNQLEDELRIKKKEIKKNFSEKIKELEKQKTKADSQEKENYELEIKRLNEELIREFDNLEVAKNTAAEELQSLTKGQIISEIQHRDLSMKYGQVFKSGIGSEAIYKLLANINLDNLSKQLKLEIQNSSGQKRKRLQKRLKIIESFRKNKKRPEWMILTVLPVIPPDLRPMVQLDGGRFATSDLNDLYRRVINRNNRLKRLIELEAPEVICRNEKRMLQEAVDALIDNDARRGKAVTTQTRRKLKSLSDILRGKQGRFRQNLLGKRVDYSGRSVIVVGPELKLHQCGLPKKMALELFKPFVISRLIKEGYAHNVKSAGRMIERSLSSVWDMLEDIIKKYYVLLNRAPTLHRLGIQAFKPVLIEGDAIQIHPLVCLAFNADFDGDQMAVHVPLSIMAQYEASEIMLSSKNLLKPADGSPVVTPSQDMVLGCYYLTILKEGAKGEGKIFKDENEAILAYEKNTISFHAKIKIKIDNQIVETSIGRIMFNEILPPKIGFINETMTKKNLSDLVSKCFQKYGLEETAKLVDAIKDIGFRFSTKSGMTISVSDIEIPSRKISLLQEADERTENIRKQYKRGLITEKERYIRTTHVWMEVMSEVEKAVGEELDRNNPIFIMVDSGARGQMGQVNQLAGMKGLVVSPTGDIIELPIRSNYREGFSVLEYFISTHGARKGKSDTALRTSDSGYLTRRLVDVAQDIVISEKDCGDHQGIKIIKDESFEPFINRILGRITPIHIIDKKGKKILDKDSEITEQIVEQIDKECDTINVRSPLSCKSIWGICQKCYGRDLGRGELIKLGEAVGIIAAQSIGEPGTQLTMRTFHAGGVAGEDITQGLPRVEELFEARTPRGEALISDISGIVYINEKEDRKIIKIISGTGEVDEYKIEDKTKINVRNRETVFPGQVIITREGKKPIKASKEGIVKIEKNKIKIEYGAKEKEYSVLPHVILKIKNKDRVSVGEQLTEGHLNLQSLFRLKGEEAVQKYIISEVQEIYASQGQAINDKHIEVIIKQMFSKLRVKDSGDSEYLPGEIIDRSILEGKNLELKEKKLKPILAETLLLGITKTALLTPSFLSAASFQETTRILVEATINSTIDKLRGLKENVIIGRLIPAGTGFRKDEEVKVVGAQEEKEEYVTGNQEEKKKVVNLLEKEDEIMRFDAKDFS